MPDVLFTHKDWQLTFDLDMKTNELIFKTVLAPNMWLAIGLSNDLLDADIIQWVAAAEDPKNASRV